MRISDWSSDVCSSDLSIGEIAIIAGVSTHVINVDRASNAAVEIVNVDIGIDARLLIKATAHKQVQIIIFIPGAIHEGEYARFRRNERAPRIAKRHPIVPETRAPRYLRSDAPVAEKNGRASCRERGCKYVE